MPQLHKSKVAEGASVLRQDKWTLSAAEQIATETEPQESITQEPGVLEAGSDQGPNAARLTNNLIAGKNVSAGSMLRYSS